MTELYLIHAPYPPLHSSASILHLLQIVQIFLYIYILHKYFTVFKYFLEIVCPNSGQRLNYHKKLKKSKKIFPGVLRMTHALRTTFKGLHLLE